MLKLKTTRKRRGRPRGAIRRQQFNVNLDVAVVEQVRELATSRQQLLNIVVEGLLKKALESTASGSISDKSHRRRVA